MTGCSVLEEEVVVADRWQVNPGEMLDRCESAGKFTRDNQEHRRRSQLASRRYCRLLIATQVKIQTAVKALPIVIGYYCCRRHQCRRYDVVRVGNFRLRRQASLLISRSLYLISVWLLLLSLASPLDAVAQFSRSNAYRGNNVPGVDEMPFGNPRHQYEPHPGAKEREKVDEHDYVTPNNQNNRFNSQDNSQSNRANILYSIKNYDHQNNHHQPLRTDANNNLHNVQRNPYLNHVQHDVDSDQLSKGHYNRRPSYTNSTSQDHVAKVAAVQAEIAPTPPSVDTYSPAGLKCDFDSGECPWEWDVVEENENLPGFEVVSGKMLKERKKGNKEFFFLPPADHTGSETGEYI